MHYYKFNIGDYAKCTRHLSNLEDLAYRRLLELYYSDESPLANDVKKLSRLIMMRENEQEVSNVLDDFFFLDNDQWKQNRVEQELDEYRAKAETARGNGKKGGRPKKPSNNPVGSENNPGGFEKKPDSNPEITGSKANHKPLTIKQEPLTINQGKSKDLSPCSDDEKQIALTDLESYEKSMSEDFDPVTEIFNYWLEVMDKKSNTAFSDKRVKAIKKRLKDGYSISDIKTAIFNCSNTDHNMGRGKNSNGTKYNDIELICRHPETLERFRDNPGNGRTEQDDKEFDDWFNDDTPTGGIAEIFKAPKDGGETGRTFDHDEF